MEGLTPPIEPETRSLMVSEGAQACRRQTSGAGCRTPGARRRRMTDGCSTVVHSHDNSHRHQTTDTRPTRQPCIPGRMRAGAQASTPRGATFVLVCGGGAAGCPPGAGPTPRPSAATSPHGSAWQHDRRFVGRRLRWAILAHTIGFRWQTWQTLRWQTPDLGTPYWVSLADGGCCKLKF